MGHIDPFRTFGPAQEIKISATPGFPEMVLMRLSARDRAANETRDTETRRRTRQTSAMAVQFNRSIIWHRWRVRPASKPAGGWDSDVQPYSESYKSQGVRERAVGRTRSQSGC